MEGSATLTSPENPDFDIKARLLFGNGAIVRAAGVVFDEMGALEPSMQTWQDTNDLLSKLDSAFGEAVELRAHLPEEQKGDEQTDNYDDYFWRINISIVENLSAIKTHIPENIGIAKRLALKSAMAITDKTSKVRAIIETLDSFHNDLPEEFSTMQALPILGQTIDIANDIKDPKLKAEGLTDLACVHFEITDDSPNKPSRIQSTLEDAQQACLQISDPEEKLEAIREMFRDIHSSVKSESAKGRSEKEILDMLGITGKLARDIAKHPEIKESTTIAFEALSDMIDGTQEINEPSDKTREFLQRTLYDAFHLTKDMADTADKATLLLKIADSATLLPKENDGNGLVSKLVNQATKIITEVGNSTDTRDTLTTLKNLVEKDLAVVRKKAIITNAWSLAKHMNTEYEDSTRTQSTDLKSRKADFLINISHIAEDHLPGDEGEVIALTCLRDATQALGSMGRHWNTETQLNISYANISDRARTLANNTESPEKALEIYDLAIQAAKSIPKQQSSLSKIIEVARDMKEFLPKGTPNKDRLIGERLADMDIDNLPRDQEFKGRLASSVVDLVASDYDSLKLVFKILGSEKTPNPRSVEQATALIGKYPAYPAQKALLGFAIGLADHMLSAATMSLKQPAHDAHDAYKNIVETIVSLVNEKRAGKSYLKEVVDSLPREYRKQAEQTIKDTYPQKDSPEDN
ncbi:MAG: hypothetical protein AAB423_00565 [Patescibacteria group bacterium]